MFNFLKQILFINQETNKVSHTKFWSNIGYGIMCYTFVYAVMYGTQTDYMLWVTFGVVVIGNKTVKEIMIKKHGTNDDK